MNIYFRDAMNDDIFHPHYEKITLEELRALYNKYGTRYDTQVIVIENITDEGIYYAYTEFEC